MSPYGVALSRFCHNAQYKEEIDAAMAEEGPESSSSQSSSSDSDSDGSSDFGLGGAASSKGKAPPAKCGQRKLSGAKAQPSTSSTGQGANGDATKAGTGISTKGGKLPAEPKPLEEGRQALQLLQQMTPITIWKGTIKPKEQDRRLDLGLRRSTALQQASLTMEDEARVSAQAVLDELSSKTDFLNNLKTFFATIHEADNAAIVEIVKNGDHTLSQLAQLEEDTECLSTVLVFITAKLLEDFTWFVAASNLLRSLVHQVYDQQQGAWVGGVGSRGPWGATRSMQGVRACGV